MRCHSESLQHRNRLSTLFWLHNAMAALFPGRTSVPGFQPCSKNKGAAQTAKPAAEDVGLPHQSAIKSGTLRFVAPSPASLLSAVAEGKTVLAAGSQPPTLRETFSPESQKCFRRFYYQLMCFPNQGDWLSYCSFQFSAAIPPPPCATSLQSAPLLIGRGLYKWNHESCTSVQK